MHLPTKSALRREELYWWEPDDDSLPFNFCRDTSLHGLKYVNQPERHISERIFWLISFCIGLGLAVYWIETIWQSYRNNPIIVSFNSSETTVDNIPFPAITICNMNKILKKKAKRIIEKVYGTYPYTNIDPIDRLHAFQLNHICSVSAGFSKEFSFSKFQGAVYPDGQEDNSLNTEDSRYTEDDTNMAKFLQTNSQTCPSMLPICIWKDENQSCVNLFKPIETDFGKCCTFNMISQSVLHKDRRHDARDDQEEMEWWRNWTVATDGILLKTEDKSDQSTFRKFPRRQNRAGKNFGLSILLDPNLDQYFCTTSDSKGFRLAAHFPLEMPHVADFGIGIAPNTEVFVNIKPQLTLADKVIKDFSLEKRLCYFPNEMQLGYYNNYTTANCVDECIANQTRDQCKCSRYYMPRPADSPLCGPLKYNCTEEVKRKFILEGVGINCSHCYRTCEEIQYFAESSTTPIQFDDGNWEFENRSYAHWKFNNVSIVHIFMGQASTYARIRKQLYGTIELVASTGGLMGLCLGFSGLSLVEVLYYFTLRAWWRRKRKVDAGEEATVLDTMIGVWATAKPRTFLKPMVDEIAPYFDTGIQSKEGKRRYDRW